MEPEPKINKPIRKKKGITKPQYKNLTPFKAEEKRYKLYYGQQTDYSQLFQPQQYVIANGYKVFPLPFPKGAYYVPNFNNQQIVMQIGLMGLNVYCNRPYRTNLDSREELYKQQKQQNENEQAQKLQQTKQGDIEKGYYFNDKIRWANVGYQYDWTLRQYPDKKTPIHKSIRSLSQKANQLFNAINQTSFSYEPESAIINYYGVKDYMTGHLDDAEIDQVSPIYSFSFGLSCVFIIGGPTRDQKPTAVKLNSGDLLIMSGQSRRCYHGVPRVIQNTFNQLIEGQKQHKIDQNWKNNQKQTNKYYQTHRININIRQVFPRQKE